MRNNRLIIIYLYLYKYIHFYRNALCRDFLCFNEKIFLFIFVSFFRVLKYLMYIVYCLVFVHYIYKYIVCYVQRYIAQNTDFLSHILCFFNSLKKISQSKYIKET